MKIHSTSWHYKVYNAWHKRKHGFTRDEIVKAMEKEEWYRPRWFRRQLDLCHYVRVVFIFAPARWVVHGKVGSPWYEKPWPYILSVFSVTGLVIWALANPSGLLWALLYTLGIIGLCLIFLGLAFGVIHLHDDKGLTGTAIKGAVTGNFVSQFVKAKKRKICPLIEVEK